MAVTIEKLGRNKEGIRHSVMGTPLPKTGDYYIDDFIVAMTEKGKLTVGIGDGGNEIGFGKIHDKGPGNRGVRRRLRVSLRRRHRHHHGDAAPVLRRGLQLPAPMP